MYSKEEQRIAMKFSKSTYLYKNLEKIFWRDKILNKLMQIYHEEIEKSRVKIIFIVFFNNQEVHICVKFVLFVLFLHIFMSKGIKRNAEYDKGVKV